MLLYWHLNLLLLYIALCPVNNGCYQSDAILSITGYRGTTNEPVNVVPTWFFFQPPSVLLPKFPAMYHTADFIFSLIYILYISFFFVWSAEHNKVVLTHPSPFLADGVKYISKISILLHHTFSHHEEVFIFRLAVLLILVALS